MGLVSLGFRVWGPSLLTVLAACLSGRGFFLDQFGRRSSIMLGGVPALQRQKAQNSGRNWRRAAQDYFYAFLPLKSAP